MIGDESVGQLAIAESPASGVPPPFAFDWRATVISQFANSPIILQFLSDFAEYLDLTTDFDAFFKFCWDIDTAVGYGLDRLGRVVNVSRVLHLPTTGSYFGFSQASDAEPFDQAPFYSGAAQLTTNYNLGDDAYRRLILAKALANISDGSIPSINRILMSLFSDYGDCYVVDNGNMTMVYHFASTLSPVDFAIVSQSGALPKPCGVAATIVQL